MEYALDKNGNRVHATAADKQQNYVCPVCGAHVVPRQGEVNRWHYAHEALECWDDWQYDMSEWHRTWQDKFPAENREVVVEHNRERHRADVLIGKHVIEFQHSPISANEVEQRNEFYVRAGYKVIWVFDASAAWDAGLINETGECGKYRWKNPNHAMSCIQPQNNRSVSAILHLETFDDNDSTEPFPWLVKVDWAIPKEGNCADYSTFCIDPDFSPNLLDEKDRFKLFMSKQGRFSWDLNRHKPYVEKCACKDPFGTAMHQCEKTGECHNDACVGCPHNVLKEYRRKKPGKPGGLFYYCCYPRVIHPELVDSPDPSHNHVPSRRT